MDRAFGARFGAGLSSGRVEDLRLVTGQGRYAANLPGDLHAAFVRSPYSHARILGIDLSEALSMPGVRLVLTGRDLSEHGVRPLPFAKVLQREDGAPMASPARWPLAVEEVHYVGDPVAVVVADDAAKARDAAEAVQVNYEELACVVDLETAVEMGAVRASLELRDNLAADFRLGDAVEVDAAIAAAPHVTRLRVVNNRVIVNPMELRSAVASYDPDEGFVWNGATQTPHLSQAILAEVLGVGEESVRVVVGDMGGAFGARIVPYPEDAALLCAARQLRRSVKWQSDRSEQFLSDTHARDHLTECTLATDNQGRILAARFDVLANMGAYLSYFGANIATHTGNRVATGVYDIPLLHVNVKVVLTNTVPTGPYRGAGRPEAIHRLERVLDVAASELGIDPVEIRRRNLVRPDSMPYTAASGATYDSGDFGALMDRALVLSDSQGVTGRREDARRRGLPSQFNIELQENGRQNQGGDKRSAHAENNHCSFLADIIVILQLDDGMVALRGACAPAFRPADIVESAGECDETGARGVPAKRGLLTFRQGMTPIPARERRNGIPIWGIAMGMTPVRRTG